MTSQEELAPLLEKLNELVFGADSRMAIEFVAIDELREQDLNANVMPTEMFNALVSNIQKNEVLESLPLVATRKRSKVKEIVSGHHRIRAAREAGITHILVLCYHGLTDGEIRAKQLAHNSIQGDSDQEIVAAIFSKIRGMDNKLESYIDTKRLGKVPDTVRFKPIDIDPLMNSKTVTIVFLATQTEDFSRAMELLIPKPDEVYLAHQEAFDGFKTAVHRVRKELDVRSVPAAIAHMATIVTEYLNTTKLNEDA